MKTLCTDRLLRGLKPAPAGTRTVIWDSVVPGLCVRVTDKGAASFSIMRRCRGKLIRRTIGVGWHVPFPASQPLPFSLADARKIGREMLHDIAAGIDPKVKQEAQEAAEVKANANTFAAVAEVFIAKHVSKLRSAKHAEGAIRRELIPVLGKKPITSITRRDIVHLLEAVMESGRQRTASHLLAYLSKIFVWAMSRELYGLDASPCVGIRAIDIIGTLKPRQRVLSDSELLALWQATAGLSYPDAPFARMLLLTGQRLREVAEMTWDEIDLDKHLWTIPAERMKSDAPHVVPLSPGAVATLESLPRWNGKYVFSAQEGRRPIAGFANIKRRIDARMQCVAAWTFHDLRRTMRTGLSALRIQDVVAELAIGHTQKNLHKVYDQHSYLDERRHAFEAWADRVMSIVEPGRAENVYGFPQLS
jgi:integrase